MKRPFASFWRALIQCCAVLLLAGGVSPAQTFRFTLRAEPDIIVANGVSSTSILVQARSLEGAVSAQPLVRFVTTAGTIEPQARLSNGVARVLLRSAAVPGTAVVTAFIGNAREQISVEFSEGVTAVNRYWQISGSPVSYGADRRVVMAAGPCSFDLGGTHIESDVRLDIDVANQWLWAQGNAGKVIIRSGSGVHARELRGERLFYDLRRHRGVIRRRDSSAGPTRQEFAGALLLPPPALKADPASAATRSVAAPAPAQPVGITPIAAYPGQAMVRLVDSPATSIPSETPRLAVAPAKKPEAGPDGEDPNLQVPPQSPDYEPLPGNSTSGQFDEPAPPLTDTHRGYWVVSRWTRVFPDDKLQFGGATIFHNATRLFFMRLYVAPLDGNFNPATNMVGINSSAGLSLRVPFYYQATARGTGAVYLVNAPRNGFAAEKPGVSLALDHEYFLSKKSQGRFSVDEVGKGGWNLDWNHEAQLSPTLRSNFFVNMPRHRDVFVSGGVSKALKNVDVGLETFFSKPDGAQSNMQGNFYARMRPKDLGSTGWSYSLTGNISGVQHYYTAGDGSGVGLPGRPRPGQNQTSQRLFGQSASAVLIAPNYKLWRGAALDATVSGTAFNYSNHERGFAPGVMIGLRQNLGQSAMVRLDYQYDKGLSNPLGSSRIGSSTNLLTASAQWNIGSRLYTNFMLSRGLGDGATYGFSSVDYYFAPKWRAGLFSDYSKFDGEAFLNYGVTLGRVIRNREVSLNWDRTRGKVYFEFGNWFN